MLDHHGRTALHPGGRTGGVADNDRRLKMGRLASDHFDPRRIRCVRIRKLETVKKAAYAQIHPMAEKRSIIAHFFTKPSCIELLLF